MTKQKVEVIVRDLPKKGDFETLNIYLKNVPVFYPVVHEVKKKFQSEQREYSTTVFVDEEAKDKLLDEVMVNKTFALVGKDKTSKPPRRIKFPLSSQTEEGKINYDLVDGMYGFSVAKPEFSKQGNKMVVNVIDKEGNPFTENVGNGSVVNLKLFGYKNREGQVVVTLDTMQVIKHVPFESKAAADSVVDDVFGVSYQVKKAEKPSNDSAPNAEQQPTPQAAPDFDQFDESIPF